MKGEKKEKDATVWGPHIRNGQHNPADWYGRAPSCFFTLPSGFGSGGSGYIGSHTLVELLQDGFEVVVLDNLVNSSKGD